MKKNGKKFGEENLPRLIEAVRDIKEPAFRCGGLIAIAKIYARFGDRQALFSTLREALGISACLPPSNEKAYALTDLAILYAKHGNFPLSGGLISEGITLINNLQKNPPDKSRVLTSMASLYFPWAWETRNAVGQDRLTDFFLYHALKIAGLISEPYDSIRAMLTMAEIYLALDRQDAALFFLDIAEEKLRGEHMEYTRALAAEMMFPLLLKTGRKRKAMSLLKRELKNIRAHKTMPENATEILLYFACGFAGAGMKTSALRILRDPVVTAVCEPGKLPAFFILQKYLETYFKLGMKKKALTQLNRFLPSIVADNPGPALCRLSGISWTAEEYLKLGDKKTALTLLTTAEALPQKAKRPEDKIWAHARGGNLFARFREPDKAALHFRKSFEHYARIDDDIAKLDCAEKLSELLTAIVALYKGRKNEKITDEK